MQNPSGENDGGFLSQREGGDSLKEIVWAEVFEGILSNSNEQYFNAESTF
jgi:hypothetical protein